jgi:hypothetical protein
MGYIPGLKSLSLYHQILTDSCGLPAYQWAVQGQCHCAFYLMPRLMHEAANPSCHEAWALGYIYLNKESQREHCE